MPTRAQDYAYTFMAGLALPALYEQIVRDYADLEQRREFVQGLIAQENQQIANLEQVFKTPATDSSTLQALLERLDAQGVALEQVGSGRAGARRDLEASYRRAGETQPASAFTDLTTNEGLTQSDFNIGLRGYRAGLIAGGATPAAADAQAARVRSTRTVGFAPARASGRSQIEAQISETEEAIRDLRQRGPTGIAGGAAGQAEIDRRSETAAPEGSSFATEEDAFVAAVAAIADGELTQDDFGSEEDFTTAKRVYDAAKSTGAFRNDQRAAFETSMLTARARLAQLEAQAQSIAVPEGMTREQELARKQAEARGYDFSKPYVRLQKSRYYSNIVRGDELFNSALEASARLAAEDPDRFTTPQGMGSVVLPTNKSQTLARDYIAQRWNSGDESLSMRQAERQLGKVLRGDELQEALSFAIAFHKGLKKNIQNPSDADQQMAAQRQAAEQQEARRQEVLRAQKVAQEAQALNTQMEQEQIASVSGMRAEQAQAPQATANLYNRLLLQGLRGREINQKLNEGFGILTTPGITEETRAELFEAAGLSQPDAASLAVAFGPQLRDIVRNASIEQLGELAENPVFAQDVRREQDERQRRAEFAEIAQTPPAGGIGLPAAASPRGVRVLEETARSTPGVIEPGELQNPDILLEEDALLERQRREANEPPPRVPGRQRSDNIAPITPQQLAVFEAMDDATLEVLRATGSVYAGNVLAARTAPQGTPEREVVLEESVEPEPEPEATPDPPPRRTRSTPTQEPEPEPEPQTAAPFTPAGQRQPLTSTQTTAVTDFLNTPPAAPTQTLFQQMTALPAADQQAFMDGLTPAQRAELRAQLIAAQQ